MHGIYELKEMLCKELEEYSSKGALSTGSLDTIDKLAHTIKNLDKIIEVYEEEEGSYADGSYENYYDRGGSYRGGSYARGRGSYAKRDSRGRYSREGYSRNSEIVGRLHDLMEEAPDEKTRQEINRLIMKMEQA